MENALINAHLPSSALLPEESEQGHSQQLQEKDEAVPAGNEAEITGLSYLAPDPPDEIIPAGSLQCAETRPPSSSALASFALTNLMKCFSTDRVWKIRTMLAVACAFLSVVIEDFLGLVMYSSVVLMFAIDCGCLVLSHSLSTVRTPAVNPLGKLALLRLPLMLVHPSAGEWFEPVCMSVLLTGAIFRDVLIMMFVKLLLHQYTVVGK